MGNLRFRREYFIAGKSPLFQTKQGGGRPAIAGMLLGSYKSFGVPEGIERPDERRALARIIMQIEERKTGVAGRAAKDLDLFLIKQHGVPAGGLHELRGQIEEMLVRQVFANEFKILRPQYARVFADFVELGEKRPLADFVSHQRAILPSDVCGEIDISLRALHAARAAFSILAMRGFLACGGRRVKMSRGL